MGCNGIAAFLSRTSLVIGSSMRGSTLPWSRRTSSSHPSGGSRGRPPAKRRTEYGREVLLVPEDRSKLGHLNFRQGRWILRAPGREEISRTRITLFEVTKVPALTVSG